MARFSRLMPLAVLSLSAAGGATGCAVGQTFSDTLRSGGQGPEMVVIPAGRFRMGCVAGYRDERTAERLGQACLEYKKFSLFDDRTISYEEPVREVRVGQRFALGRYEVTVRDFRRFADATGHRAEGGCQRAPRLGNRWAMTETDATRSWRAVGFLQSEDHPVVCVSWNDARAYAALAVA